MPGQMELPQSCSIARAARNTWRRTPLTGRIDIAQRFLAEMRRRTDKLANAVIWQISRPRWQADETPRLAMAGGLMAGYAAEVLADTPYDSDIGLTASVWTANIERGVALMDDVDAGTIYLNRCDHIDLYLPWGGIEVSSMGRTGLIEATQAKSFHIRRSMG